MTQTLFKIYAVLTAIFATGMVFFMIAGSDMSKLFAIGLLWCIAGMAINGKTFAKLSERVEKLWKRRE